jgi:hypothetical protein
MSLGRVDLQQPFFVFLVQVAAKSQIRDPWKDHPTTTMNVYEVVDRSTERKWMAHPSSTMCSKLKSGLHFVYGVLLRSVFVVVG